MKQKVVLKALACIAVGLLATCAYSGVDYGSVIKGDERELHVDRFGKGQPIVVSNGYLFVDGRYVSNPYTIQRVGQAVVVNDMIVNCLYTREIPLDDTRQINEFKTQDGKTLKIKSPPHPASGLKGLADVYVSRLSEWLRENVVVLSKEEYQKRQLQEKGSSVIDRCMPLIGRTYLDKFPEVVSSAMSVPIDATTFNRVKSIDRRWSLNEEDTLCLLRGAVASNVLMERIRSKISAPQDAQQ